MTTLLQIAFILSVMTYAFVGFVQGY